MLDEEHVTLKIIIDYKSHNMFRFLGRVRITELITVINIPYAVPFVRKWNCKIKTLLYKTIGMESPRKLAPGFPTDFVKTLNSQLFLNETEANQQEFLRLAAQRLVATHSQMNMIIREYWQPNRPGSLIPYPAPAIKSQRSLQKPVDRTWEHRLDRALNSSEFEKASSDQIKVFLIEAKRQSGLSEEAFNATLCRLTSNGKPIPQLSQFLSHCPNQGVVRYIHGGTSSTDKGKDELY